MGGPAARGALGSELPDLVVLEVGVDEDPQGRPLEGIVKLSGIAMIDPQHTGFATGLEPIILGVGQPDSA